LLDSRLRILLPGFSSAAVTDAVTCIDEVGEIERCLDADQKRILRDHLDAPCHHLLVKSNENGTSRACYLIFSRIDRWRIPYCYVHYVSDLKSFEKHQRAIRKTLRQRTSTQFIAVNARWFAQATIPWSFEMPIGSRQLYRSQTVQPEAVDSLYSELPYLNLSTFPDLSSSLSIVWNRRRT
jgi:hypothetical protein